VRQNSLNVSNDDMLLTIGHSLRAWYDDILHEDVPARLSALIERLDRTESEFLRDSRC
jgi:Anti-sigma factor NepR